MSYGVRCVSCDARIDVHAKSDGDLVRCPVCGKQQLYHSGKLSVSAPAGRSDGGSTHEERVPVDDGTGSGLDSPEFQEVFATKPLAVACMIFSWRRYIRRPWISVGMVLACAAFVVIPLALADGFIGTGRYNVALRVAQIAIFLISPVILNAFLSRGRLQALGERADWTLTKIDRGTYLRLLGVLAMLGGLFLIVVAVPSVILTWLFEGTWSSATDAEFFLPFLALCFLGAFVYLFVRRSLAPALVIFDSTAGVLGSVRRSVEVTREHRPQIWALFALSTGLLLISLWIGLLITVPVMGTMWSCATVRLASNRRLQPPGLPVTADC